MSVNEKLVLRPSNKDNYFVIAYIFLFLIGIEYFNDGFKYFHVIVPIAFLFLLIGIIKINFFKVIEITLTENEVCFVRRKFRSKYRLTLPTKEIDSIIEVTPGPRSSKKKVWFFFEKGKEFLRIELSFSGWTEEHVEIFNKFVRSKK